MFKVILLSPAELEPGFYLSGVQLYVVNNQQELLNRLKELKEKHPQALIIVPEEYYRDISPFTREELSTDDDFLIVAVPLTVVRDRNVKEEMENRIAEILGFKLILTEKIIE